jgi:ABC-2 type transport system ATP-binding protein
MIILKGISKYFGKNCAVKNINIEIKCGDLFAILGPNGAGKSTILGILSGIIRPSHGTILINDEQLLADKKKTSCNIGVLFENPTFYDYLSGKENLVLLSKIKKSYDKKEILHLLELVSLSEKSNMLVKKYSLGMKQRLALAAALINNPSILILDEPTNGLDPEGIHIILSILKDFSVRMKKTIIISSHQVYDIESLCNKIAIMKDGNLICQGK